MARDRPLREKNDVREARGAFTAGNAPPAVVDDRTVPRYICNGDARRVPTV